MSVRVARERCVSMARAEPSGRVLVYVALVTASACISVLLIAVTSLTPPERALLVAVALGAWVLLVALGWTRGTLPLKPLLVAIGITLVLAVGTPSNQSGDGTSYARY